MKIRSVLKSTHDLKKNGYIIFRKLHKLENRDTFQKVYSRLCPEGIFVVLSVKHLCEIYADVFQGKDGVFVDRFLRRSVQLASHLEDIATSKRRINNGLLSSYLVAYTKFFNLLLEKKISLRFNDELLERWYKKCLMAYVAAWGNNI
ncbi:MAG: hypothetical protein AAGU75_00090 [Bacillota bacterium]